MSPKRSNCYLRGVVAAVVAAAIASGCGQTNGDKPVSVFTQKGTGGINALGYLPSRNLVVIGSEDGVIRLWNPDTMEVSAELKEKAGFVAALAIDPKEIWIAASYGDKVMCVWDVDAKKVIVRSRIPELQEYRYSLAAAPGGDTLAFTASDRSVRIWQISTQEELKKLAPRGATIGAIAFSRDGSRLVSGDDDGTIVVWDLKSGSIDGRVQAHDDSAVIALLFLGDSSRFASAAFDKTIVIWDARSGKKLTTLDAGSIVWRLALSPDGKTLASAHVDGNVMLWDTKSWRRKQEIDAHFATSLGIFFDKDGKRLITSCVGVDLQDRRGDGEVKVWKIK